MSRSPWYRDGLCFECTRCGNCCTGGPGTVLVTDDEIAALARRLDLDDRRFRERYTRTIGGGNVSLREKADYDCVFYDRRRGCTVYEDRPRQCRTWPFWRDVVKTPESWERTAACCPGMNQGPRHSAAKIRATIADDGTSASLPVVRRISYRLATAFTAAPRRDPESE